MLASVISTFILMFSVLTYCKKVSHFGGKKISVLKNKPQWFDKNKINLKKSNVVEQIKKASD